MTGVDAAAVIDAAMRAVLDPGSFTPRGSDGEGRKYGERMNAWQRRALAAALAPAEHDGIPGCTCQPVHQPGCPWRLR